MSDRKKKPKDVGFRGLGETGRGGGTTGRGYPGQIAEEYMQDWQGSKGGYVYQEPKCSHEGTAPVFRLADTEIDIYGASKTWARESSYLMDFVIDCGAHIMSGSTSPFVKATGTLAPGVKEQINGLNELVMNVPAIAQLDWPDQGIPAGGAAFWLGLVNILPDPGRVLVCCIGGHGRTGTCMASLLLVTQPNLTAKQAIDAVRGRHCKHAIETLAQERYLCALSEQVKRLGARAQALVAERAREAEQGQARLDEVPPAIDGVVVKK